MRVRAISTESFGIEVADLHRLDTERDDTYVLDDLSGRRMLLKVANPTDSFDIIDLSVRALEHACCRDAELPIPKVIPNSDDELLTLVAGMDGELRYARLLTW